MTARAAYAPRSPSLPAAIIWELEPGMHADGCGLYLKVQESGSRAWVMIYFTNGRRREMGLGSARLVTLDEARDRATVARRQIMFGRDPISSRRLETRRRSKHRGRQR